MEFVNVLHSQNESTKSLIRWSLTRVCWRCLKAQVDADLCLIISFSLPVFNQGEEGTSWYIILKGSVNVVIYGKVGIYQILCESLDWATLQWPGWCLFIRKCGVVTGRCLRATWRRRLWEAGSRQWRPPRCLYCPARGQLSLLEGGQGGLQQDPESEFVLISVNGIIAISWQKLSITTIKVEHNQCALWLSIPAPFISAIPLMTFITSSQTQMADSNLISSRYKHVVAENSIWGLRVHE